MNKQEAISSFNQLGSARTPFLFIIDYKQEQIVIEPLSQVDASQIKYSINGLTNYMQSKPTSHCKVALTKHPETFSSYQTAFNQVMHHLKQGNSYLCNLTFKTPIDLDLCLNDIFHYSKASYKLVYKDEFVVFSPETFVKIKDNKIYSYPMKGTIDAKAPNAVESILNDKKEAAEHATIVDLIRNDLSQIATHVKVDKYRYIDTLKTDQGDLLQVSSKISGDLETGFQDKLGDLFFQLLPAGSICGAPKNKTLKIIDETENYDRGYYTGIVGLFDGKNLDSGVMIRFIEKCNNQLFFKSGGGITAQSDVKSEFDELIRKIYLPF